MKLDRNYLKYKNEKTTKKYGLLKNQKNIYFCCHCGNLTPFPIDRVRIIKYENNSYRKLCNLCNNCYEKVLQFLEIGDI